MASDFVQVSEALSAFVHEQVVLWPACESVCEMRTVCLWQSVLFLLVLFNNVVIIHI
jgi:hypothetical protein